MKSERYRHDLPPENLSAFFPKLISGNEPIRELSDFWLRVECLRDGTVLVPLRLLCARFGWKVPLRSITARLRCKHCGGRPDRVVLIDRAGGDGHSTPLASEIVPR